MRKLIEAQYDGHLSRLLSWWPINAIGSCQGLCFLTPSLIMCFSN